MVLVRLGHFEWHEVLKFALQLGFNTLFPVVVNLEDTMLSAAEDRLAKLCVLLGERIVYNA